jgi:nucleoside-diphosphate-sugar epimerase
MPTARRDHVVVAGAAGFIGSHLAEALLDRGHEVVGVDAFRGHYPAADKWSNLAGLLGRPGFELHRLDVFHLAARPGVRTSFGPGFDGYLHDNVLGTQRLLEGCVRAEVPRLVFASSSSVYGDAPSYPVTEESRTRPVSPYGVTKLAAEQLCRAYAGLGGSPMAVAVLRYFTVYGPRQGPDMGFRRFIEAALAGRPVVVYGDGGRRVGLHEALELIGEATGRRLRIDRRPPLPGDARHTGADGTRAEALLGYRPETDLAAGLAAQVAWITERRRAASG